MNLPRNALLALSIVLTCAASAAFAQDNNNNNNSKWDLKPLIPPVFPVPPSSKLDPATVGNQQAPYTTAPLQSPSSSSQSTPGLKLSIPTRQDRN
jgi:hypothetical protein